MEDKKYFFSIVLPIYNVEKYLERCIESILNQRFKDYEIILVDDQSPDNCSIICDNYAKKYDNINVIHKKNEGLGLARNSGLDMATGKYIWFIDSDDFIESNSLDIMYNYVCNNYYPDVVVFGYKSVNKDYNILDNNIPKERRCYEGNEKIINELLKDFMYDEDHLNYSMSAWSKIYNINFLKDNNLRFHSEREWISEDYYFTVELFKKVKSLGFIDRSLYNYFKNGNSLTTKYRPERFDKNVKFYKKMDEIIVENNYPEECKYRMRAAFISNLMSCLKMEVENHKKVGFKTSYTKFKEICSNEYVKESVFLYSAKSRKWRIFESCIKEKKLFRLYIMFYIKNIKEMKRYD